MIGPSFGFVRATRTGFDSANVKPGALIVFKVIKKVDDSHWIISLKGQEIKVQSQLPLEVGSSLKAKVSLADGVLSLRLQASKNVVSQILTAASLPDSKEARMVIDAFFHQGLPLREEMLRKVLRAFLSLPKQSAEAARLMALLFDKGIVLDPQQFERLQQLMEGPYQYRPAGEARESGKREQGGRRGKHEQEEREREKKNKTGAISKKSLRRQILRSSNNGNLLQLFNHLEAPHNNWIVIPLLFNEDDPEKPTMEGRLRLHGSPDGVLDRCSLSFFGQHSFHFSMLLSDGRRKIELYMDPLPPKSQRSGIISSLDKKLHNLRFEIDDTIKETRSFSSIQSESLPLVKKIDTIV